MFLDFLSQHSKTQPLFDLFTLPSPTKKVKSYQLQRPGLIVGSDVQYKHATSVKSVYLYSFTSGNFNAVLHTSSERVHILLHKFNHDRKLF